MFILHVPFSYRQIVKKRNETELNSLNGSEFSKENNLYIMTPEQMSSLPPPPSYTTTWRRKENSQTFPKPLLGKDDIDEYEYEALSEPDPVK